MDGADERADALLERLHFFFSDANLAQQGFMFQKISESPEGCTCCVHRLSAPRCH